MKERGILFTAANLVKVADETKPQTRRVMRTQLPEGAVCAGIIDVYGTPMAAYHPHAEHAARWAIGPCPYGVPGDRLWVREPWATEAGYDWTKPRDLPRVYPPGDNACGMQAATIWYSDELGSMKTFPRGPELHGRIRSPRFMPKWAARLWLELTDVRVERVQDISVMDCVAEGIAGLDPGDVPGGPVCTGNYYRDAFGQLWDSINAKPKPAKRNPYTGARELCKVAYPWDAAREETVINRKASPYHGCKVYIVGNPWNWPLTYKLLKAKEGNHG